MQINYYQFLIVWNHKKHKIFSLPLTHQQERTTQRDVSMQEEREDDADA